MSAQLKLNIAWLYPDLMNIYGDRGNIICLTKRCQWRGIEVEVTSITVGDEIDPQKHDLYFFGGGQDQQQTIVSHDLQKEKGKKLIEAVEKNRAVVLAICGGYQLLGKFYHPHEGLDLPGISLLDTFTVAGHKRMIDNVVIEATNPATQLVGFENHSGKTYLGPNCQPLGTVVIGFGNNGNQDTDGQKGDKFEGAVYKTVFGTYLHGSLLPKNPDFADHLIKLALERRYGPKIDLKPLNDTPELTAHQSAVKRARQTH